MAIAVKRYTSAMTSAPTLTGVAGTLVSLLDACLVNGFNTTSPTGAEQTSGTATLTFGSAHGYQVNDVIALSGANESAWNNEFLVLTVATNTLTFAIDSGTTSPATGTLSCKVAPLGWSKPYSDTNKAAYLPAAAYCQNYLRVLDDSTTPTSASGRWAKLRGYETMSDVDTGTGLFPTTAQVANGISAFKSSTSDATARNWWLAGDGGIFYLGIFAHASYLTAAATVVFGDINSLRSGDAYSTMLVGTEQDTLPSYPGSSNNFAAFVAHSSTQVGKYIARSYTQLGSSVAAGFIGDHAISLSIPYSGVPGSTLAYPHPPDNGLLFAPIGVVETSCIRSRALPGLYYPLHITPLAYLDIVTSLPDFPNRTFQAFDSSYSSYRTQTLIDITGPWR